MKTSKIALIGGGIALLLWSNSQSNPSSSGGSQPNYGSNAGTPIGTGGGYGPTYGGNNSVAPYSKGFVRAGSTPQTTRHARIPSTTYLKSSIVNYRTRVNPYRGMTSQQITNYRNRKAGYVPGSIDKLFQGTNVPGARMTSGGGQPYQQYYAPPDYYAQSYTAPSAPSYAAPPSYSPPPFYAPAPVYSPPAPSYTPVPIYAAPPQSYAPPTPPAYVPPMQSYSPPPAYSAPPSYSAAPAPAPSSSGGYSGSSGGYSGSYGGSGGGYSMVSGGSDFCA